MERRGLAFFARVREGLREIGLREPRRVAWLDGTKPVEALAADVWKVVSELFREVDRSACN
jgi:thymidylate kinase